MADDSERWCTVANSRLRSHQKEPAQQWLDRVLDLPPTASRSFRVDADGRVRVRDALGASVPRTLPASRVEVLRAYSARASGPSRVPDRRPRDGAGWILCDARGGAFLLTQKDDLHPNPRCRGRLACLAGSVEDGESLREGALRELYEELRDPTLADEVAARGVSLGAPTLAAVQRPGDYRMAVWLATAQGDMFARWSRAWSIDDALSEAAPIVLSREALADAIAHERAAPGSRFVASHHVLFALALEHTAAAT